MLDSVLMVTGGSVDIEWLHRLYTSGSYEYVVGVDKGIEAIEQLNIKPNLVVGDFDSANDSIREKYKSVPDAVVLNPMKDLTDTHAALLETAKHRVGSITLVGATGSRVDHMLGNINILQVALGLGVDMCIVDSHNRIRMIDKQCVIRRDSQYGRYVSLMPYTDEVKGVTLTGFLYNLEAASMIKGDTLGISNEIREEEGRISIEEGNLLVLETKD